jgi:hypothetical protein
MDLLHLVGNAGEFEHLDARGVRSFALVVDEGDVVRGNLCQGDFFGVVAGSVSRE